jgi:DeoR/GlpR family transcriptional regulator of sugar metabolism
MKCACQKMLTRKTACKAAMSYIKDGDNAMFDSAPTVLALAKELVNFNHIGVITYDLYVALELINKEFVDLLMIGGVLRRQYYGFHGYFAEKAISRCIRASPSSVRTRWICRAVS